MNVRNFMAPPQVSSYTTNEPEPDRHASLSAERLLGDLADIDPRESAYLSKPTVLRTDGRCARYRISPSANALRDLNAATQIGRSPNILGIVPPFAPRFALP